MVIFSYSVLGSWSRCLRACDIEMLEFRRKCVLRMCVLVSQRVLENHGVSGDRHRVWRGSVACRQVKKIKVGMRKSCGVVQSGYNGVELV